MHRLRTSRASTPRPIRLRQLPASSGAAATLGVCIPTRQHHPTCDISQYMSEARPNQGGIAIEIVPTGTGDGTAPALPADRDVSPMEAGLKIGGSGQADLMPDASLADPVVNAAPSAGAGAGTVEAEISVVPDSSPQLPKQASTSIGERAENPFGDGPTVGDDATEARADRGAERALASSIDKMHEFSEWFFEFMKARDGDPLRVTEVASRWPGDPVSPPRDQLDLLSKYLEDAKWTSMEYGARFAGRVSEHCKSEHWTVQGRSELVIDHFVTVKIATSLNQRLVEVNGERLGDPVTVERTIALIGKHRAYIMPDTFDAQAFLRLLFDAYRHVLSERKDGFASSPVTLRECFGALAKVKMPAPPASPSSVRPLGGRPESLPPVDSVRRGRPVKENPQHAEIRFRSDLSRLIAGTSDLVVDGQRMILQQLRGDGGMAIVEPRSQHFSAYRYVEFRRLSTHAE